jgi:predicted small secreted protein
MLSQKYIDHNNQTILWNTIKNVDLLNEVFGNAENMKVSWFKNIIEFFYTSMPKNTVYESGVLVAKNKETIAYMIDNLKTIKNTKINKNIHAIQSPPSNIQNQFVGNNSPTSSIYSRDGTNRTNAFLANFSERQKEYENMIKKPAPPTENIFEDKIEDSVISNMDELIKQHMKQREDELSMYAMPAPPGTLNQSEPTGVQVSLKSPAPSIGLTHPVETGEKKVIWATDVLNAINELKNEMAEIKNLLLEIKNTQKII